MKVFKKAISLLLCAIMMLSIIPLSNIEAEAATYTYPKISALKVPRIQQPGGDTTGMCHFNSIASIIAYRLGSYSYDGYSRTYSYGTDYAYSSDPIWQKMSDVNNGNMDPTYSFSKYPVKIETKKVSGNNAETYKLIYNQLKLGNPVVVYGPYHASVVIGYTASTNSLDASKFSVMEITKDGNWWSNSKSYFDSYANAPQTDRANNGPMPCYVTLSSWLSYCNVKISRISYCEGTPKNTLSVYYNANGGSISSDTYYLSSGNVYKTSDKSKLVHKWYYNDKQTNGLYDDTTFGLKRDGYTFVGWGTTPSGEFWFDKSDNTILPTDLNPDVKNGNCSMTLYAVWEEVPVYNYYELAYDANGGSGAPESLIFEENETVYISEEIPTRFGYTFDGWQTEDGWWYYPGQEAGFFESTVLYASWSKINVETDSSTLLVFDEDNTEYYVEFVPDESRYYVIETYDTDDDLDTVGTLYSSSEEVLTGADDYGNSRDFRISYYLNEGETYFIQVELYSAIDGETRLRVTPAYDVTFDPNGGYGAPETLTGDYKYTIPYEEPYRDGYTFLGWSSSADQDYLDVMPGDPIEIIGDVTLYAVWESNRCTISYKIDGENCGIDETFYPGDYVAISERIPEAFGKNFVGWSESGTTDDTVYYPGDVICFHEDIELNAIWNEYEINENTFTCYKLTASKPYCWIKFIPDTSGEHVIKSAYTDDGMVMDGYVYTEDMDCIAYEYGTEAVNEFKIICDLRAGETYYIAVITNTSEFGDTYLFAARTYSLYFDANGGTGAPAVCYGDAAYTIPDITPVREGYIFLGWSEDQNATEPREFMNDMINVRNETTLYAVWASVSASFAVLYDANGGTNAPKMQLVGSDDVGYVPNVIPTRVGYEFEGWCTQSDGTGQWYYPGNMLRTQTDMTNMVLYAIWSEISPVPTPDPEPDNDLHVEIKNPSTTKIDYKNGIILHAEISGELPDGARVVWETSNGNFKIDRSDDSSCRIMSSANGLTDITVKIVAADGEILAEDYVTMTSNAGFFQKIIAFFKSLFGIPPKVLPQIFKKVF